MYQSEIWQLKDYIKKLPGSFEACTVLETSFKGIEILGARKIPNSRGLHCVFVDLEDYRGNDFSVILNGGNRFTFNKPTNEVAAHIDIYSTDNRIQIVGNNNQYSQVIGALSFAHTVYGHSSYYVYARFTDSNVITHPTESEAKRLIREMEERLKRLKEIVP